MFRFLLGQWRLKYPVSEELSSVIKFALKFDIVGIKESHSLIEIKFSNGMKLTGWNANRFDGWLSLGCITNSRGLLLTWKRQIPSSYVMWRLLKRVNSYLGI